MNKLSRGNEMDSELINHSNNMIKLYFEIYVFM